MTSLLLVGLLIAGGIGLALIVPSLLTLRRERTVGRLRSADVRGSGVTLSSARLGLIGRPDEIRLRADGRSVPVELKSRASPRHGPTASHLLQVEAYCFLLEETTGRSPPFGILRYGDGEEWEIPWTPAARRRVLGVLDEVRQRYDGRADPSAAKCRACGWRESCDARAPSAT